MYRREILRNSGVGGALATAFSFSGCLGLGSSSTASGDVNETIVEMTDDDCFESESVTISGEGAHRDNDR